MLTPVQHIDGLYFKRDDLYRPFGEGVNGGKMRQAMMLVESVKDSYSGVISYCSIHSPQAPITAAAAKHYGLPCIILYGGTKRETVQAAPMARLCLKYGARVVIGARSGRHNVLHAKAREIAVKNNYFIVQYGINLTAHSDVLLRAVSEQVANIPDELENLIITCGSGITSTGVMVGLKNYGKRVKNVHLVATAPDRREFIHDQLKRYGADREFHYHDLFHEPGFQYEKNQEAAYAGIELHPHYEAKTMKWFANSGIPKEGTLFWIVGAEPKGG